MVNQVDPKLQDFLVTKRAVHPDVVKEREYWYVAPLISYDGERDTTWDDNEDLQVFAKPQRRPGIVIPTYGPDGQRNGVQLRPDHPRRNGKGSLLKYENPKGSEARRLDIHPRMQPYLTNPEIPLFVTEGVPKADALASHGMVAVALFGVGMWRCDDWRQIVLRNRDVFIVFDSDALTNKDVWKQQQRLGEFLEARGARAWTTSLPPDEGEKVGVDDWLASFDARWGDNSQVRIKQLMAWSERLQTSSDDDQPLEFRSLGDIRKKRKPLTWAIKGFWLSDGFGFVGGAEKTLKSWTMLAVAVAKASGRSLFNDDRFQVPQAGKVLVLTGEGGVDLTLDRIDHLCQMYGVQAGALDDAIHVTDQIIYTSSEAFRGGMEGALWELDPAMVIVDPAYVYLDDSDQAGNVFKMGRKLADVRDLCRGRATLIGHHFTKAGAKDLSLSSLTQAGFREVADHWLLMGHAEDPDLEAQRFKLSVKLGARRGFGLEATFVINLGALNEDTLQHDGKPSWVVGEPQRGDGKRDRKADVLNLLRSRSEPWTPSELALEVLGDDEASERGKIREDLRVLKQDLLADMVPNTPANREKLWFATPQALFGV